MAQLPPLLRCSPAANVVAGLWWASPTGGVPGPGCGSATMLLRGGRRQHERLRRSRLPSVACASSLRAGAALASLSISVTSWANTAGPFPCAAGAPPAPVSLLCIPAVPCTWHRCPLVSCPLFLDHPLCFSAHHELNKYFLLDSSFLHLPKLLLAWSGFGSFSSNFCKAKKTPGDYFVSVRGKIFFFFNPTV